MLDHSGSSVICVMHILYIPLMYITIVRHAERRAVDDQDCVSVSCVAVLLRSISTFVIAIFVQVEQITTEYRLRALKSHPDKNQGNEEAGGCSWAGGWFGMGCVHLESLCVYVKKPSCL